MKETLPQDPQKHPPNTDFLWVGLLFYYFFYDVFEWFPLRVPRIATPKKCGSSPPDFKGYGYTFRRQSSASRHLFMVLVRKFEIGHGGGAGPQGS